MTAAIANLDIERLVHIDRQIDQNELLFRRGEANGWQPVSRSDLLTWLQVWANHATEKAA